jgi:hypothetical protein
MDIVPGFSHMRLEIYLLIPLHLPNQAVIAAEGDISLHAVGSTAAGERPHSHMLANLLRHNIFFPQKTPVGVFILIARRAINVGDVAGALKHNKHSARLFM